MTHLSSCAVHNEPAYPAGPCTCGEWAREEAHKAYSAWCADENDLFPRAMIEAALIKARSEGEAIGRAKGMREAAEIATNSVVVVYDFHGVVKERRSSNGTEIASALRTRAEAIERGE